MSADYDIKLGDAIKEAWALFLKAPEVYIVLTLVSLAVGALKGPFGQIGQLVSLVVTSLLPGAYFLVSETARRNERASFHALEGLPNIAPQLLMVGIGRAVLILVGLILLLIPGIYAAIALMFTDLFVVLYQKNFWEAMKESHALMRENWLGSLGLLVFIVMFCLSGLLFVGIGILVTAPLSFITLYCCFRQLMAHKGQLQDSVVVE